MKGSALAAVASLVALVPAVASAAETRTFRIERGEVRVTVPLMPGGAFEAKSTALSGTVALGSGKPLPLTGDIRLELTGIDTGIDLRNQHLREKYLEVAKGPDFDKAVLSEVRLADADGEGFQGRTAFSGSLLLHGVKRQVTGTGEIRRQGLSVQVEARFALALTDFGIEPPEYLGVGVANKVMVKVQFSATPAGGAGR